MSDRSFDYEAGYQDGVVAAYERNELAAYYAGVGYGKNAAGDKSIGFNSHSERESFEKGISNRNKHFGAYKMKKKLNIFERLFGSSRRDKKIKTGTTKRERPKKKQRFKVKNNSRKSNSYSGKRYGVKKAKRR